MYSPSTTSLGLHRNLLKYLILSLGISLLVAWCSVSALPVFPAIFNLGYAANLSTNLPLIVSPIIISLLWRLTRNVPSLLSAVCSTQPLRNYLLTLTTPEVASGHFAYAFGEVVNNPQGWLKSDNPKGYNTVRTHGARRLHGACITLPVEMVKLIIPLNKVGIVLVFVWLSELCFSEVIPSL